MTAKISPYTPAQLKDAYNNTKPVQVSYSSVDLENSNADDIRSFKYDPLSFPLKSTQQLNIDWSKFENHTFFSSAEVKVNEAFNNLINGFPFDGSKKEVESFFDKMTGFENWVFDQFPTWSGALHFSGTTILENPENGYDPGLGTWIAVKDKTGNMYPEISKNNEGKAVLTPSDTSFSFETQLYLPNITNDTQVVFQKISDSTNGYTFFLKPESSTAYVTASFVVSSGSFRNEVEAILTKGSYNHVCLTINKELEHDVLEFYVNESLKKRSDYLIRMKKLSIDAADLTIGSGSSFYSRNSLVVPVHTLSGTIDEFRIFSSTRSVGQQQLFAKKGLYSTPDLRMYYRFNEPPPPLSLYSLNDPVNSIVLDSSGNSLHSQINNFTGSLRVNAELDDLNPVKLEKKEFKKILFPAHTGVLALNKSLLSEAKVYDEANPNIIIKLIPPHYLLEGADSQGLGFENLKGDIAKSYGGSGIPGQGSMGSTQIILSFLYIWAKFFDDIKMYIDSFVTLKTVSYDNIDTIPDNFLEDLIRSYGVYIPSFFNHSTLEQYSEGENLDNKYMEKFPDGITLKKLQANLLRRILVNIPDVLKSKGTQHSIRSFLRSVGIDPDNSLRIREYGGSTTKSIKYSREKKTENSSMVGIVTSSYVFSPYLSSPRVEPGYPLTVGTFTKDEDENITGTTDLSDNLLTSGSWAFECLYRFPIQNKIKSAQSLMRLLTTGSLIERNGLIANIVATQRSKNIPAKVTAYFRPGSNSLSPVMSMSVNILGDGVFDADKWNVSFGCKRNDEIGPTYNSSSYFLRVGKSDWGELNDVYIATSSFCEKNGAAGEANVLQKIDATVNASGTFVEIGKNGTILEGSGYRFLNNNSVASSESRTNDFFGLASNFRFWSRSTSESEWREHIKNYRSLGSDNPYVNYNFVNKMEGSYGKIRIDSMINQSEKYSDKNGEILLLDFSKNNLHMSGTGFDPSALCLRGEPFIYSSLSPTFDEASVDPSEKIRIRSFNDENLIKENIWASKVPSYAQKLPFSKEEPVDDTRLSIEFSLLDALDKDIVSMFSTFDELENAIGDPNLIFSSDYPRLETLRDVYFNRLSEKMNFRNFLEFYRWFDVSISSFMDQIIPSKTRFKGSNFVIESHMLERHKTEYRHHENYMGENQIVIDSQIFLQQIVGTIKKY